MLLIFSGKPEKTVAAAQKALHAALKKQSDSPMIRLEPEEVNPARLSELAHTQGLFGGAAVIVLSRVLDDKEAAGLIAVAAQELADSPALFIATGTPDAKTATALKKHAETYEVFDEPKKAAAPASDRFALANALASRDKKNLWIRYSEQIAQGAVAEELHGILFWQVKTMLLAHHSRNAEEAGLKPFPYSKAKSALKNWKPGEVEKLSGDLVSIYHRAHRGEGELSLLTEKLLLSI